MRLVRREKSPENIPPEIPIEPNIPANDAAVEPDAAISTEAESNGAEPAPVAIELTAENALAAQIAALKHSNELQRQHHAAMMAAQAGQALSREQKLAAWQQQGMHEEELKFLAEHPKMIDRPNITQHAAALALQAGMTRGTPEFLETVRSNFKALTKDNKAQASPQPVPEFFKPPEVEPDEPEQSPGSIYSAPVSRETPSAAGVYREPSPSSVTLSIEEKQIARSSGISETEYARQKLRMLKAQATGELQK
jgi:hypothetical protein